MSSADEIIRNHEQMAQGRGNWENHWREIAELILPRQDEFEGRRDPGDRRTNKIFDATAAIALDRFAAVMDSMLTPRGQKWHGLVPTHPELARDRSVMEYMEDVTRILFAVRYNVRSNFASQNSESFVSTGAFGTGPMFIDDAVGSGTYVRYKSIHMSEIYFAENHHGIIDTAHRKFEFTAKQMFQKWGDACPDEVMVALEKTPDKKFEIIHCVKPRDDRDNDRMDYKGMAYESYYVSITGKKILSEGGYRTFPYAVKRYITSPHEVYGRSPAMLVLPEIKMINQMAKSVIRQAQKNVEPPLLLSDDGVLNKINTQPNALNFGGVDPRTGNPTVVPLQTGGNVMIGLDMMERTRNIINDAFLVNLFQILEKNPRMTATEVMERSKEKGALLSPSMGRMQSEAFGPMIEREIDILQANGLLPEMPDVMKEAQGEYEIVYESPLNRAQRAEEGIGMMRTMESIAPLLQTNQNPAELLRRFNMDEVVKGLAEINGVPLRWQRSDEELQAMDEQAQQQQQIQQMMEAAPVAANTAKTMAEAQALTQGGGVGGL
jgi:hypothetical protein